VVWFQIIKRQKYNFPMMKVAVRRVVDELDGEPIGSHDLQKKIAENYADAIKEHGTPSEKAGLGRLKNLTSIKPFTKLIRNYGYSPKTVGGTIGEVTISGMGSKNAILDSIIWEKPTSDSFEKTWSALSNYPPKNESHDISWRSKLNQVQGNLRNRYKKLLIEVASNPLTPDRQKAMASFYHELVKYGEHILAQRLKKKVEGLGGKL